MKERTALRRQPRPVYYTRDQLDRLREKIIVSFCRERYGQELNPIPTEALLRCSKNTPTTSTKWPTCPKTSTGSRSIIGTASQP